MRGCPESSHNMDYWHGVHQSPVQLRHLIILRPSRPRNARPGELLKSWRAHNSIRQCDRNKQELCTDKKNSSLHLRTLYTSNWACVWTWIISKSKKRKITALRRHFVNTRSQTRVSASRTCLMEGYGDFSNCRVFGSLSNVARSGAEGQWFFFFYF